MSELAKSVKAPILFTQFVSLSPFSIRANQHTETLQAQYHLLVQQRDEFSAKLSAAEDKESRSEAALINLQCALEQFQNSMLLLLCFWRQFS